MAFSACKSSSFFVKIVHILSWLFGCSLFPLTVPSWFPYSTHSSCNQANPNGMLSRKRCFFYHRGRMASRQRWAPFAFLLTSSFKCPWKSPSCCHSGGSLALFAQVLPYSTTQSPDATEKAARGSLFLSFPLFFQKQLDSMKMDANKLPCWDTSWSLHPVGTSLSSFTWHHSTLVPWI